MIVRKFIADRFRRVMPSSVQRELEQLEINPNATPYRLGIEDELIIPLAKFLN